MPLQRQRNSILYVLMLNMFIALLGVGIIIPVMPVYLEYYEVGGAVAGQLVAIFGLFQFLISPLAGKWTDRYGRKWLIVAGLCLNGIAQWLFALKGDLWFLYVSRMLGGTGVGLLVPATMACVADLTDEAKRNKGMGYLSAAMSLGITIGPGIGGGLSKISMTAPFYAAAFAAFAAAFVTAIFIPETFANRKREHGHPRTGLIGQMAASFRGKYLVPLLVLFAISFGLMSYETVFPLHAAKYYGLSVERISVLITAGALMGIIAQSWLLDKLVRRHGERKVIQASLAVAALTLVLLLLWKWFWFVFAVSMLFFTATSILRPAAGTLLSKLAGEDEQGFVSGLNSAYSSIGSMLGPLMAGMLYDLQAELPYLFAAFALMAGIWILEGRRKSRYPQREVEDSIS